MIVTTSMISYNLTTSIQSYRRYISSSLGASVLAKPVARLKSPSVAVYILTSTLSITRVRSSVYL